MRAASLLLVFVVAKCAVMWNGRLPEPIWSPLAYVWQDAAVALGFCTFERMARREWAVRGCYWALVLLAAINVPVARVLSSPLTVPMVRAARGALRDSIGYHLTAANLIGVAAVILFGSVAPAMLRRLAWNTWWPAAIALVLTIAGAVAATQVDTAGMERNSFVALIRTSIPRVAAAPRDAEWRTSPYTPDRGEDLSHLHGAAAGQNVLIVVLESTAARYLRAYGAQEDPTPTLTALAARSIVFEDAYAAYPESVKGLVAILAARFPAFDVTAEQHRAAMSPSIATAVASAGYETALFHSGRFMYLGMKALVAAAGFDTIEDAGDIGGNRESSFGIDERATVDRILAWIDAVPRDRPFLATYLPIAGHHPYMSSGTGPFTGHDDITRYRNALFEGDRALGALLDGLRVRHLDRATLIVVLGDHGEAFGQHTGNYGHTLALFDENVRVPMILFVPGAAAPQRVHRTASTIDVAPTILDLVGIDRPAGFEGRSLLEPGARMALFFTDYSLGLLGLRDGCIKFVHEIESGRSQMFDVCKDPDERENLLPLTSDRAAFYREQLQQWSADQVARVTNDTSTKDTKETKGAKGTP